MTGIISKAVVDYIVGKEISEGSEAILPFR